MLILAWSLVSSSGLEPLLSPGASLFCCKPAPMASGLLLPTSALLVGVGTSYSGVKPLVSTPGLPAC